MGLAGTPGPRLGGEAGRIRQDPMRESDNYKKLIQYYILNETKIKGISKKIHSRLITSRQP